ncbi:hypothetical protein BCO71033_05714 [Burkholderia contaminans]|uniref:Uncharacterized protein n=1 Tax=Burkholderia contaminans TaxID=488447 RepID=A0A6P3B3C9_9BURK|nr:hypothetical protein CFB82_29185 [Burkholderia sp. HI2714]VWD54612.1 hypothetical protein BCO71033_05714 [Burkholderia contaminans]
MQSPRYRPTRRRREGPRHADGSEVHPLDALLGSSIEWDPHRSVGDFASTVILKRRWKRIGFADDGEWHLAAFNVASQV